MNPPKNCTISMEQNDHPVCPICMSSDSAPVEFSCSHSCCEECWTQIINSANSRFMVNNLICFHLSCKKKIENIVEILDRIPDKDIVSRFRYLKKKQEIINNKDKFLCPNQDCREIIDSLDQENVRLMYKNKSNKDIHVKENNLQFAIEKPQAEKELQPIDELDYSFLVCEHCNLVFCKVCEIYHKPGEASCLRRKNSNSDKILQVFISYLYIII